MGRRRPLLYLAGLLFVLLWGLPRLFMPLATDQAYFALGARTILEGDQLYTDFWDIKTPVIYLLYSFPGFLLGEHVEAFRLLDFVNTVLAMAAVFFMTRRFFSERAALAALMLYGFAYLTTAGLAGLGQTESFMVAPLMMGLALYPTTGMGRRALGYALLAGLAFGVMIALKPSGFVLLAAVPLAELLFSQPGSRDWNGMARRVGATALGVFAVQTAWMAYLVAAGSWPEFLEIQQEYTVPYSDLGWAPESFSYPRFVAQATTDWFRGNAFLLVPVWIALVLSLYRPVARPLVFMSCVSLLGILSVWWQGKFFVYHWIIMLPLLAPLAGHAIDRVVDLMQPLRPSQRYAGWALLVVGFLGLSSSSLFSTYDSYRYMTSYLTGSMTREELEFEYLPQLQENRQLVSYIEASSSSDESFYLWGFWTAPYYWLDRPVPTRFYTSAAVRASWAPQEWREEFVTDLIADPPRFIAVAGGDEQPWLVGTTESSEEHFCRSFPELRRFVEDNYEPVFRNDLFVLYDRDAQAGGVVTWCDQIDAQATLSP